MIIKIKKALSESFIYLLKLALMIPLILLTKPPLITIKHSTPLKYSIFFLLLMAVIAIFLAFLAHQKIKSLSPENQLFNRHTIKWSNLLKSIEIAVGLIIIYVLLEHIPVITQASLPADLKEIMQTSPRFFALLHIILLGPIFEEFVFRGILYAITLKTFSNSYVSIILTNIIFAVSYGTFLISSFFPILLLGICSQLLFIKTKNLNMSCFVHILFNGILTLSYFINL